MVENILVRRESERGRVLTYNKLYAFVEDPRNTFLLQTLPTLETFIRDKIELTRALNLRMESIPLRFKDVRAVADEIVYNAQRVFAAIPKPTLIVLAPTTILVTRRTQTQTLRMSSSAAMTSQTARTTTSQIPSVAGLLQCLIAPATRPIVPREWALWTNEPVYLSANEPGYGREMSLTNPKRGAAQHRNTQVRAHLREHLPHISTRRH